ncbi:MAG: substrate-binding domain-containing protein, partial [Bacteroidota bacterium]
MRNNAALNFLNNKTFTIGVIVPSITSFFNAAIIDGIQKILEPLGYSLNIFQSKDSYLSEVRIVEKLLSNNAEGIFISISSETKNFEHFDKVMKRKVPLIFFDRNCDYPTHRIGIDHYISAKMAVRHLIDMGCRRIAHLKGPDGLEVTKNRLDGYLDTLKEYDLPIDENLIQETGFEGIKGVSPMRQLLSLPQRPDGIHCSNRYTIIRGKYTIG